ncbi:MAG: hypothetical protein KDD64_09445, partial [Bdellovibrionales bacterium]|nr:hypothetical protein [Bdellovibrionales bacterium]
VQLAVDTPRVSKSQTLSALSWFFVAVGVIVFFAALWTGYDPKLVWGAYYTNFLFFAGLAAGGVMTSVIVQIVRAVWCVPVRRIGEAHASFLPYVFFLFLGTYFGKEYLFPWATAPMPGREWWMQPNFVYLRFAILFFLLFYALHRYVSWSLRSDVGFCRENASNKELWKGFGYKTLTSGWKGSEEEIPELQRKMSIFAPVIVVLYAVVWTLFATEMICGMDTIWFSNMFGGFEFLGNIYMAWAAIAVIAAVLARHHEGFSREVKPRQLWDLGMLTFGFCMLWGYTFFSQFLPQWYSNMPEETQWLILRTREMPWMSLGWLTFACAFIIPFITLLSEDIKRVPGAFAVVASIVWLGLWMERYVVVMAQLSPSEIPFGPVEVSIFLGMLGVYLLCLQSFFNRYPFMTVSHPQAQGETSSW